MTTSVKKPMSPGTLQPSSLETQEQGLGTSDKDRLSCVFNRYSIRETTAIFLSFNSNHNKQPKVILYDVVYY